MRRLTVLYDPHCGFCVRCRRWLGAQRQLVPLDLIPAGSIEARRRFPTLTERTSKETLTVIDDAGGLYEGTDAWIMCLYALEEYRDWSLRLAQPSLRPMTQTVFDWVSRHRAGLSWWFDLSADEQVTQALSAPPSRPSCAPHGAPEDCR